MAQIPVQPAPAQSTPRPLKGARLWLKALRVHQWVKNILLFTPLVLSHILFAPDIMARSVLGFASFCSLASGTYLINDLFDLAADRLHATKRFRPLASGQIRTGAAILVACVLIVGGLGLAFWLSTGFLIVTSLYLAVTLGYTLGLKREPLLDALVLGGLFMLRVIGGLALAGFAVSIWLGSFTMMLFTSLALAKRHTEVVRLSPDMPLGANGRGYAAKDAPLVLALGQATAVSAIVIMLLYMQLEAQKSGLYPHVGLLFLIPIALAAWLARIWVRAARGELDDDPVIFAIKDPGSWMIAAIIAVIWALAIR